jgi:hypothetical protein
VRLANPFDRGGRILCRGRTTPCRRKSGGNRPAGHHRTISTRYLSLFCPQTLARTSGHWAAVSPNGRTRAWSTFHGIVAHLSKSSFTFFHANYEEELGSAIRQVSPFNIYTNCLAVVLQRTHACTKKQARILRVELEVAVRIPDVFRVVDLYEARIHVS